MRYTENTDGLPAPLWLAVQYSDYNRGDSEFSITDLIKPPQIVQLTRRHEAELPPQDPRSNIYRVLGSAVHDLLEKVGVQNPDDFQMIEERLFAMVAGVAISGQIDLHTTLENGVLTDWKYTKTSAIKFEKLEWHQQLNSYAHFLRMQGKEVTRARICCIFRDWSQSGMNGKYQVSTENGTKIVCKRTRDYPDWGVSIVEIPLWSDEQVASYLEQRVKLHKGAESLPDQDLPECTPEERWRRDTWRARKIGAVKARGNKSNFRTKTEAREYLEKMGPEFELSVRPGVAYRCLMYCVAAPFCTQLKRENWEVEWVEQVTPDSNEE